MGQVRVHDAASEAARVRVIAGRPLAEPIAQYGPFVMKTSADIEAILRDYRDGKLGTTTVRAR